MLTYPPGAPVVLRRVASEMGVEGDRVSGGPQTPLQVQTSSVLKEQDPRGQQLKTSIVSGFLCPGPALLSGRVGTEGDVSPRPCWRGPDCLKGLLSETYLVWSACHSLALKPRRRPESGLPAGTRSSGAGDAALTWVRQEGTRFIYTRFSPRPRVP